ncbi:unnamed protein product [Paramecium primaurelia]|uniref:Hflx-type G domain-containing protein n=1 Tax=Paramecium primaurelia TaxID=5886 RepID=A0A8S1PE31_PARPR|nr:unnamed protein product [Paramecium primaurelia]
MLIKRLSNIIVKYRFSKEILDFAKSTPPKQQLNSQPVNCMVLHPVLYPNKGPELELYMAEEAIGLSKSLSWTLEQGPFWKDEYTQDIRRSQGKIDEEDKDNQSQEQNQQKDFQINEDDLGHEWRNKIIRNSIAKSSLVKVPRIHSTTFFTKGKLAMLGQHIQSKRINAVFINHELTPLQTRNLEKLWTQYSKGEITSVIKEDNNENIDNNEAIITDEIESDNDFEGLSVKVFDRFTMILQIFAKRSTQGVSRLQIELSFLKFAKTKLVRSGSAFVSLSSIFKGDLMMAKEVYVEVVSAKQRRALGKMSGSGESELQLQRRLIDDRIAKVKKLIDEESQQRSKIKRKKLIHTVPRIALIGYTNAGKSQLLNCILQKEVVQSRDLLFQTLDTTSKSIRLASGQKAIMLDTIGFITDLPHDLVESFKSTLEEVEDADIVLHIRDISHPCTEQQKQVVLDVLKELGFNQDFYNKKMIEVWNKIDLMNYPIDYEFIESQDYPIVPISALMNINIKRLLQVMEEKSNQIMNKKLYRIKYNIDQHFERLKWLYENGNISGVMNEIQIPPIKKGDPTIIEYDVIIDEITYNRYIATFQPEMRIKKNKGMPPSNWK